MSSLFHSRTSSRSYSDKAAELESTRSTATSPMSTPHPSKDLRAMEHSRQRTRKTADLIIHPKAVEAKRSSSGGAGHGHGPARKGKLLTEDELEMLDPTPLSASKNSTLLLEESANSAEVVRNEVKLTDLIVARKHGRGRPWEHIDFDNEDDEAELSYAQIAKLTVQTVL
ncbi:hypothetical protein BDQ17DRAFT_1345770 [Cyathus striatus]|nr:hypothetical protein BDQ17DRAFT_1345770 [Cyathus striatus]